MDAIINLNKPSGITSNGAIGQLKRLTGEKKMGHLGTLDPMANGVLPIFTGKMTKLIPYFNQNDKAYRAEVTLGAVSDTLDAEGVLSPVPIPAGITLGAVEAALARFTGEITQVPPIYSALKQDGRRLYDLARKGVAVEPEARQVTVYWIREVEWESPKIRFEVFVSKGTYIRSLARDLGEALGSGAHLSALTRTRVGEVFELQDSIMLDQIEKTEQVDIFLRALRPASLLSDWNQLTALDEAEERALRNGNRIPVEPQRIRQQQPLERRCYITDRQGQLLCAGFLEFSQDSLLWFQPEKVLV
ncbi:MAG: tRNA pseudouridine(55) synthase TruB [bacterium]|nr:tRNA pseudouridine(55) synthase TruB [bacterium]